MLLLSDKVPMLLSFVFLFPWSALHSAPAPSSVLQLCAVSRAPAPASCAASTRSVQLSPVLVSFLLRVSSTAATGDITKTGQVVKIFRIVPNTPGPAYGKSRQPLPRRMQVVFETQNSFHRFILGKGSLHRITQPKKYELRYVLVPIISRE